MPSMFESRTVENKFLPLHGTSLRKAQHDIPIAGRHYLILMPMTHAAEVTLFRALVAILVVWVVSVLPAGYLIVTAGRPLRSHFTTGKARSVATQRGVMALVLMVVQ